MKKDRNEQIMKLISDGHAYSAVAERIGVTRNAVSGVVFRHKHPDVKRGRAAVREDATTEWFRFSHP